jgi:poly-gamma-glutamate synthesis protein (capsule biosynthesis protein)
MYLTTLSLPGGRLLDFTLVPFRIGNLRLNRASESEAAWLRDMLDRESGALGCHVVSSGDNSLKVLWQ